MIGLPYESLIAVAYGLLGGVVPAVGVGLAAIGIGHALDRPLSLALGAVVTTVTAIGIGLALDVFHLEAELSTGIRIVIASSVACVLGIVATSQGNRVGTELPRDRTLPIVRGTTLSADAIDAVDAVGQVTIRPAGGIREFEGSPSLSPPLRRSLESAAWRLPADLQLAELERRLEQRLRTTYDLSHVAVSIDGRGRATITAAPPTTSVGTALADGTRAVTLSGLLPTGLEAGDRVAIDTDGERIHGEVLAVGDRAEAAENGAADAPSDATARHIAGSGFDGGNGRVTVAVETAAAGALLAGSRHRVVALPSGDNHEFEAAALLATAGQPVTSIPSPESLEDTDALGIQCDEQWQFPTDSDGIGGDDFDRDAAEIDRAFVAGAPTVVSDR